MSTQKSLEQLEDEAREWIETITKEEFFDSGNFNASLADGVLLCKLLNNVQAGSIPRYNSNPKNAANRMDNVGLFLRTIRGWGMKEFEMFSSNDLSEGKNMKSVVNCIHALGRLLQSGEFAQLELPKLGVKVAEKNVRVFTEEQLAESRAAMSALSLGSSDKARSASKSFMAGKSFRLGPGQAAASSGGGAPQANYGGKVVLPPGWDYHPARDGKRTYYGHKGLGISVWEKPTPERALELEAAAAAAAATAPLPEGWVEKVSRSTGKTYYFRADTNTTTFDRPVAPVKEVVEPEGGEAEEPAAAEAAPVELPNAVAEGGEAAAATAAATATATAAAVVEAPAEAAAATVVVVGESSAKTEGEEEEEEEEEDSSESEEESEDEEDGSKKRGKQKKKGGDEEDEEEEDDEGGSRGAVKMVKNPLRVSKSGGGGKSGGKGGEERVPMMPKGWEEFRTKEGAYYYHNRATGVTTWAKPKPI